MSNCKFYVINTQKSKELVDGLHQITLECENRFDAHGFLWINEEDEIISPAIEKAKIENILSFGPYPADSFFGSDKFGAFDGILAMYHDQGLIPFKTLAFGKGVNFTSGLSFVRTSPDHGTAFEIAGENKANEQSFREAVFTACDIYKKRQEFNKIHENPLPISEKKQHKSTRSQRTE